MSEWLDLLLHGDRQFIPVAKVPKPQPPILRWLHRILNVWNGDVLFEHSRFLSQSITALEERTAKLEAPHSVQIDLNPIFNLNATHFKLETDSLLVFEVPKDASIKHIEQLKEYINNILKRHSPHASCMVLTEGMKLAEVVKVPRWICLHQWMADRHNEIIYLKVSEISSWVGCLEGGSVVHMTENSASRIHHVEESEEEIAELIKTAES